MASSASICCQSGASAGSALMSSRTAMAKAAIFGPELMINVTGVGAPWYTSGIHMWKGTTPSLKASPETTNTRPKTRNVRSEALAAWRVTSRATSVMVSVPVAP